MCVWTTRYVGFKVHDLFLVIKNYEEVIHRGLTVMALGLKYKKAVLLILRRLFETKS